MTKSIKKRKAPQKRSSKRQSGLLSLFFSVAFAGMAFVAWKRGYRRLCAFMAVMSISFASAWALDLDIVEAYLRLATVVTFIAVILAVALFSIINLVKPSWARVIATHINLK